MADCAPTRAATWLEVAVVLAVMTSLATAIPGNYITNELMNNQKLADILQSESPIENVETCTKLCVLHETCDAFSYSAFHKKCEMYKMVVGSKSLLKNTFNLFVREKTEEEGYYKYGTDYIRLMYTLTNIAGAVYDCNELGGVVVPIKEEKMNALITTRMMDTATFRAFIGITDEAKEGVWLYFDGSPVVYTNWDWNGMWERRDYNCAVVTVEGKWKHTNCENSYYFICQVPMF